MARTLFLLLLATLFNSSIQQGCPTVRISGSTSAQLNRMTTYTMTGQLRSGRPVYLSSRSDYLYYYNQGIIRWYVGNRLGTTTVGMYLKDDRSIYADSTSGTWYLASGGYFFANSLVRVSCEDPSAVVDGQWSHWGSWSTCSSYCSCGDDSCVAETVTRTRQCITPPPRNGGSDCVGNSSSTRECQCRDVNECSDNTLNDCDLGNGGSCVNTVGSYYCECDHGYNIQADGKTCQDIDECADGSVCQNGTCANTIGSYNCTCGTGYMMNFTTQNCEASRIRLVGGPRPNEGRVEVRPVDSYNWGTICRLYGSSFGTDEGNVVCRMLGYPGVASVRRSVYYYGQGSGHIYMDDIVCTGTERSLFDCSYSGWGIHGSSCTHNYDVGVLCFPSSNLGCRSVRFEGSFSAQHHRMTVFTMTGEFHGNRPVYKAGSDYLFYYPSDGSWHVGPYLGSATVGMYVDDRSVYPEDISGTWYLLDTDGKHFVANRYVAVFCASSEGLTTFRIALGAFAAGLVIMLIIGICSCKVCCKKKGSVADSEHNTPPEGNSNTVEPPLPVTPPPATPPPATPPPSTPPPAYSPPSLPEPDGSLFVRVVRLK